MRALSADFHCGDLRGKLFCLVATLVAAGTCAAAEPVPHPSLRFGAVLFKDDFREGLGQWQIETERPGKIRAERGALDIDVPAGATLWFRSDLFAPAYAERFLGHMSNVLKTAVADPAQSISTISLLSDTERAELRGWNATQVNEGAAATPGGASGGAARCGFFAHRLAACGRG